MRTNAGQHSDTAPRFVQPASGQDASAPRRPELPIQVPSDAVPLSSLGHPVGRRSGPEPTQAEREADALAVIDRWRENGWR
jgi:hypothetical protein